MTFVFLSSVSTPSSSSKKTAMWKKRWRLSLTENTIFWSFNPFAHTLAHPLAHWFPSLLHSHSVDVDISRPDDSLPPNALLKCHCSNQLWWQNSNNYFLYRELNKVWPMQSLLWEFRSTFLLSLETTSYKCDLYTDALTESFNRLQRLSSNPQTSRIPIFVTLSMFCDHKTTSCWTEECYSLWIMYSLFYFYA